ncbi:MAG: hypothetical protein WBN92_04775, partial [Terriglobia bacterium]
PSEALQKVGLKQASRPVDGPVSLFWREPERPPFICCGFKIENIIIWKERDSTNTPIGGLKSIDVIFSEKLSAPEETVRERTTAEWERWKSLEEHPPEYLMSRACRETIKENLKSPSTADFPDFFDRVNSLGKGAFELYIDVDAQNGFGAKIRSNFTCEVQCSDRENCRVLGIKEN